MAGDITLLAGVDDVDRLRLDTALRKALGPDLAAFESFAGQCHAASLELVRSGVLGPEARVARGACSGVGGQHSWVVVGDPYDPAVPIVDPTLWSYDETVVGIWYGSAKDGRHCPHGGSGTIWTYGRPPEPIEEPIDLTPSTPLSKDALAFLDLVGPLDRRGWSVLIHSPVLGWPAGEIIAAIDDTPRLTALVPIDVLGMVTDRNPKGLYR